MTEYKLKFNGKFQNKGRTLSEIYWLISRNRYRLNTDKNRLILSGRWTLEQFFKSDTGKTYTKRLFALYPKRLLKLLDIGVEVIEINMCKKGCKIKTLTKKEIIKLIDK